LRSQCGTAFFADGELGGILLLDATEVAFSGAAAQPNKAQQGGPF
jgi:hypothetical protein